MKIKENLLMLFNIIFSIVILFIIKVAIFDANVFLKIDTSFTIITLLMLAIVIYIVINIIINRLSYRKCKYIALFSLGIIVALQLLIAKELTVYPSWDFGVVFNQAEALVNKTGSISSYFYGRYPNNYGILFIITILFKILKILSLDFLKGGILFNIIMIDIALIMVYVLSKKLYGYKVATLSLIMAIFITPFYMYSPIIYTDTISMPFPLIMIFFYLKSKDQENFKRILYIFIGTIVIAIGILVKTNVIISVIALVIYDILTNKNIRISIINIGIILSTVLIINMMFNVYLDKISPLQKTERGYPATHWIMMGLVGDGQYNHSDVEFTEKLPNKEVRRSENIKEIKKRLNNYGFIGYLKFLNHKIKFTWSDGTMFSIEKLRRDPKEITRLHQYVIGDKKYAFVYLSQVGYLIMLINILIGAINLFKGKKTQGYLFNITIFGVFLFLILWETRSRYLVCFLGVFMLSASNGIFEVNKYINKIQTKGDIYGKQSGRTYKYN